MDKEHSKRFEITRRQFLAGAVIVAGRLLANVDKASAFPLDGDGGHLLGLTQRVQVEEGTGSVYGDILSVKGGQRLYFIQGEYPKKYNQNEVVVAPRLTQMTPFRPDSPELGITDLGPLSPYELHTIAVSELSPYKVASAGYDVSQKSSKTLPPTKIYYREDGIDGYNTVLPTRDAVTGDSLGSDYISDLRFTTNDTHLLAQRRGPNGEITGAAFFDLKTREMIGLLGFPFDVVSRLVPGENLGRERGTYFGYGIDSDQQAYEISLNPTTRDWQARLTDKTPVRFPDPRISQTNSLGWRAILDNSQQPNAVSLVDRDGHKLVDAIPTGDLTSETRLKSIRLFTPNIPKRAGEVNAWVVGETGSAIFYRKVIKRGKPVALGFWHKIPQINPGRSSYKQGLADFWTTRGIFDK